MIEQRPSRENHLILVRYFCALSIMLSHSAYLFDSYTSYHGFINHFIRVFPGVPTLFFVSGFLVSLSYKGSSDFLTYIVKRILRIYPTLWVSVFISTVIMIAVGQMIVNIETVWRYVFWVVSQATIFPVFNPDEFRDYGVGVVNGSLWVIPIIFQFYLILPILVKLDKVLIEKFGRQWVYYLVFIAGLVNMVFWYGFDHDTTIFKIVRYLTLVPWLYIFLIGYVFQRDFHLFKLNRKYFLLLIVCLYAMLYLLKRHLSLEGVGLGIDPISFFLLALFFLNVAFLPPTSSHVFKKVETFMEKNDVTLGVFVFQMIVANLMIEYTNIDSGLVKVLLFILLTVILAWVSNRYLESPIRNSRDLIIDSVKSLLNKN